MELPSSLPPLPPTAQVIADVIGRQPTLELAKRAKYRAIYVPYHCRDNHWITKAVGRSHADRLSREFGGLLLPLAKCEQVSIAQRNQEMLAMFRGGKTIAFIAAQWKVSERTVERALDPRAAERNRALSRAIAARRRAGGQA